jgi:excisionase family DNA binding protein
MNSPGRRRSSFSNQPHSGRITDDHPVEILDNTSIDSAQPIHLLTINDVAKALRLSSTSVRRLQLSRRLAFVKVGGGVRFLQSDITAYLKKGRVDAIDQ